MHFNFWKWEGTGNDFILFDRREWDEMPNAETIGLLCDRSGEVGADGVIFFAPMGDVDGSGNCTTWEMDYINADGTRSFCGNGSRALFAFLRGKGWMPLDGGVLLAYDGEHRVQWNAAEGVPGVAIRPVNAPIEAPAFVGQGAHFVDTGSPHHLEWVDAVASVDVEEIGRQIRHDAVYAPHGTNVNFVVPVSEGVLQMRTYERGVEAETRACGTGAVAAALADYAVNGGASMRKIIMPGGTLVVEWEAPVRDRYEGIWLFGAAKELLKGQWNGAKWLLSLLLMVHCVLGQAAWSDQLQVSLLTGSPGADLYSAWGHTAIRVLDLGQTPPVDWTYNYGTFHFDEGFYLRFMKGQLDYRLSRTTFGRFQQEYLLSGRAIMEQPLALAPEDARQLVEYLEWNHLPENRVYAYKFFEDNCSSRVLHVMEQVFDTRWNSQCDMDPALGLTYREALRPYMQGDEWITVGIDFILGPRADRVMPPCGSSFLPDGLMLQLQKARLDGVPVSGAATELLPPQRPWFRSVALAPLSRPLYVAWGLLLWTLAWAIRRLMQFRSTNEVPRWENAVGKAVLVIAAVLGVLLAVMWAFTDHRDAWANWNLVWASPLLLLLAGGARRSWQQWWRWVLSVGVLCFLLLQAFLPQFVPFTVALLAWSVWLSLDPWRLPWKDA